MAQSLHQAAGQNYNLTLSADPKALAQAHAKTKLSLVADEHGRIFVLKPVYQAYLAGSPTPQDYSRAVDIYLQAVERADIPHVRYRRLANSLRHFEFQDQFYVLYPLIDGEPFTGTDSEITSTARAHAELNKALRQIPAADVKYFKRVIANPFLPPISIDQMYDNAQKAARAREQTPLLTSALSLASSALSILPETQYQTLPAQITHKDIWPANALYKPDHTLAAILDPDELMFLPKLRDIVYAAWYFATMTCPESTISESPEFADNERRKFHLYLNEYVSSDSLTTQERKAVPLVAVRMQLEDLLVYTAVAQGLPTTFEKAIATKEHRLRTVLKAREEGMLDF